MFEVVNFFSFFENQAVKVISEGAQTNLLSQLSTMKNYLSCAISSCTFAETVKLRTNLFTYGCALWGDEILI
jgi:hypothetical protein